MTTTPDHDRRLRLRAAMKLLLAAALGAFAVVALGFVFGDRDRNPGAPRRVPLHDLAPGDTRMAGWDDRPVIILHREGETIEALVAQAAAGEYPAWLVVYARGTGRGCPVLWEQEPGHFRESCGNLRYDAAGRPLTNGHAPLERPPYRIEEGVLVLGRE